MRNRSEIPIKQIRVSRDRLRPLGDVTQLAASIAEIGLLQPIVVTPDFRLISGRHRLAAAKKLRWKTIPVIVRDLKRLDRELAEIDENLIRNELSVLERAEHMLRRKAIYEARYPDAVTGSSMRMSAVRRGERVSQRQPVFAYATAAKIGRTPRTVQHEVQIASKLAPEIREQLKPTPVANSKSDLLYLARLPADEQTKIAAAIARGRADTVGRAREVLHRERIERQRRRIASGKVAMPKGVYEVISVDPPWPYREAYGTEYDPRGRRVANPYPEMSLEQIGDLKIPAADDAILFLWTTHRFLRHSFPLLDRWGFREVSTITWNKVRHHGPGCGYWLRSCTEFCIMAVRGSPKVTLTNQTTYLEGTPPGRRHSAKPDEFYELVESLTVGRRLDMFARTKRDGWARWGAEAPG